MVRALKTTTKSLYERRKRIVTPKLSTDHAKFDQLSMDYLDIELWLANRVPNDLPEGLQLFSSIHRAAENAYQQR